ncbi:MAG TPA: hypothetical protein VG324_04950 [Blastocatellia bacterium]|nr:hypothetical protein [Blastocatellia bacterium]
MWNRDAEEDDILGFLIENYEGLRSFLEQTKNEKKGAIITLS